MVSLEEEVEVAAARVELGVREKAREQGDDREAGDGDEQPGLRAGRKRCRCAGHLSAGSVGAGVKTIDGTRFLDGRDDLGVALRAAGLDDRR